MIDLTNDPKPDVTSAEALGHLERGGVIRTPRPTPDDETDTDRIHLHFGDQACEECAALIEPDAFGAEAPLLMILARQKQRYGATYCPDCLDDVQAKAQTGADTEAEPETEARA